jgi:hypothetical protein
MGGGGGSGGGTGGGTGTGGAAGGAGDGVSTLPNPLRPRESDKKPQGPSMPEDGSKPNPAPSDTARSATGLPGADAGDAPQGGPPLAGAARERGEQGGETEATDTTAPPGVTNGGETRTDTGQAGSATAQAGSAAAQGPGAAAGNAPGANREAGDGGDEAESGGELVQEGDGEGSQTEAGVASGTQDFGELNAGETIDERRAATRGRLDASLAVIQREALGERQRVQRAANAAGSNEIGGITLGEGADATNGGGNGTGESPAVAAGGESAGPGTAVVASNAAGVGGSTTLNGRSARQGDFDKEEMTSSYAIPGDIPSGDDDNTVARQLREAAMREPDPDLREKLWDEYRRYVGLPTP